MHVIPSWAVTTTVIVFRVPEPRLMAPLALPLATVAPFTFTLAEGSEHVGVTVTLAVEPGTLERYENMAVEKAGISEPDPTARPARLELVEIGTTATECMALGPVAMVMKRPPVPRAAVDTATGTLLVLPRAFGLRSHWTGAE